MAVEQLVVFSGEVDRPPDSTLELFHGIKQALHQVQPDNVMGGTGDDDVQVGIQVFRRQLSFEVTFHADNNFFHAAEILGQGSLCRVKSDT